MGAPGFPILGRNESARRQGCALRANRLYAPSGAVIPPNREFLAVLGDQRQGMNIEAPAEMIRQMVADGIRAAGIGSGNRSQTVILQVGRRELGRVVYELNKEETQRVGVRLAGVKA